MHDSADNNALTPAAAALWQRIPAWAQAKLLANVWCSHCGRAIAITDFRGEVVSGDLLLTGACPVCGATVRRLVESEPEPPLSVRSRPDWPQSGARTEQTDG